MGEMATESKKGNNRVIVIAILGGAVIIAIALAIGLAIGLRSRDSGCSDEEEKKTPPVSDDFKSKWGKYRFGAVASNTDKCSEIGTDMMARHRGNAVDAMVATIICSGMTHAHSSGIGGGALIVVYNRTTRQAVSFNARETAPAFATVDMYVDDPSLSTKGGKAIAIPGELKGLWEIHQRYGSVPWATLLQPTVDLCDQGSPLTGHQQFAASTTAYDTIKDEPEFSYLFNNASGTPVAYPPGHIIYRQKLGRTLKAIATEGISAFYNGSLTDDILLDISDRGGNITREDLLNYQLDIGDPVTLNLTEKDLTFYSAPLPGSGLVLQYMINILSGYNFSPESISTVENSVLTYHRIVETMKFAYAVRSELGDSKLVNVSEIIANMTSPEVVQEIRSKIDDDRTYDTAYYGPKFEIVETPGTAHFSVVDASGNAVAVTSTINTHFGSKVKGSRTGIVFNNEMDDFSTPNTTNFFGVPASPSNFIAPGKRPMSSMSPTVVVQEGSGEVQLVVGGAGGTRITTAVALVILRTLWFNQTVMKAVEDPRIHHQLMPKEIDPEPNFSTAIKEGLARKGHAFVSRPIKSDVVAIRRTLDGWLEAVSDYRYGGAPDGF